MDPLIRLESQLNLPSPLHLIPSWNQSDIQFYIKRDDLIDPYLSGNKYRKLKGHLSYFLNNRTLFPDGILTYGGAYSNHLYATAAACKQLQIPLTAIVRGLEVDSSNPTLSFIIESGGKLIKISRSEYRLKIAGSTVNQLVNQGSFYHIPEGGNSELAHHGVKDLVTEIYSEMEADYICIMSGTGATAEGILNEISTRQTQLVICSAVRDVSVKKRILSLDRQNQVTWIEDKWGGFGKSKPDLQETLNSVMRQTSIPLEYVYTGRLMAHLTALREENFFDPGSKVVIIHTGGLRVSNH